MSNILDALFAAEIPRVPYSWTWTQAHPNIAAPPSPGIAFATGVLSPRRIPNPEYFIPPLSYVDSEVKLWGAVGIHLNPASIVHPQAPSTWVNQLMIQPSGSTSSYTVLYGNRTNFAVEVSSFQPEIYLGSGFPGSPALRTCVLTCRFWLGITCLVLVLPNSFSFKQDGESDQPEAATA